MIIGYCRKLKMSTQQLDDILNGNNIIEIKKEDKKDCLFRGDFLQIKEKKLINPRCFSFEIEAIGLIERDDDSYFTCKIALLPDSLQLQLF